MGSCHGNEAKYAIRLGVVSGGLGLYYSILVHNYVYYEYYEYYEYYVDMTKTWAPKESCKPL